MARKKAALKSTAKDGSQRGVFKRTAFNRDGTPRRKPGTPDKPKRYMFEPGTLPVKGKKKPEAKIKFAMLNQEQRRELADHAGISPLQFLVSVFREDSPLPLNMKIYAAGIAAPYMHCRMPSAPPVPEHPDKGTTGELRSQILEKLQRMNKQGAAPVKEKAKKR